MCARRENYLMQILENPEPKVLKCTRCETVFDYTWTNVRYRIYFFSNIYSVKCPRCSKEIRIKVNG